MSLVSVIPTFLVPLVTLFLPGIILLPSFARLGILATSARIILWSMSLFTLTTFGLVLLHIPVSIALYINILIVVAVLLKKREQLKDLRIWFYLITISLIYLSVFFLFSLPFLFTHDALPTGDSQKSILWAQEILITNQLPDYQKSVELLNRDPVDFYTPGLHSLTAFIMSQTKQSPFTAIGFFSIASAVALAIIAAAIPREIFHSKTSFYTAALTGLFLLTQLRFLRYIREPGYHYQNLIGELFLFGFILLALSLIHHWRWSDAILTILVVISLALSHQFSTFIAAFVFIPLFILLITTKHQTFLHKVRRHVGITAALLATVILLVIAGVGLGLHEKIPHLFTTDPHLLPLVPSLIDYPVLMGGFWITTGLAGLILLVRYAAQRNTYTAHTLGFVITTCVLLLLSQGPRFGVDIPPVRALFYTAVPLSITSAYFVTRLFQLSKKVISSKLLYLTTTGAIAIILVVVPATTLAKSFTLSHTVRTNSTLRPHQTALIEKLASLPEGRIIIDDYNRRSASWLILSGQPMVTRIAADIHRQMQESDQSKTRHDLYLKQLDYEKIFTLGSQPAVSELLTKHSALYLTGIDGKTTSTFNQNPNLAPVATGGDITIYQAQPYSKVFTDSLTQWLLRPSTLANDIGDEEDVFAHLQASLRTPRVSEPRTTGQVSYRTTTAPEIPLTFNVGDYTEILWDKEHTGQPDTDIELYIRFAGGSNPRTILTPDGTPHILPTDGSTLRIPASQVPFDEHGFITITLQNPTQSQINIDLIALGLARIP